AIDLAFPLRGGTFVVLQGGASILTNSVHRFRHMSRDALDIAALAPSGNRAYTFLPSVVTDYAAYGVLVMSPCDGTVAIAREGVPGQEPGGNAPTTAGNQVVIRRDGSDVFVAMCHLKPGSVRVRPGARVKAGDPLAQVGTSGNSIEPHLHIQANAREPWWG